MTYQLIILYIIIIIMLFFSKPAFLYDSEKQQYKEFGTGENQTMFTLPFIAIILAVLTALFITLLRIKSTKNENANITYKFIPVPVYYQQPMIQLPFNQINQTLANQLEHSINKSQIPVQSITPIQQPVNQMGGQFTLTPEMLLSGINCL